MRRLLCAFIALIFCTAALSAECPIGTTPAKYVQLEYIESTGTQWIDTGVKPISDYERVVAKFSATKENTASVRVFGSQNSSTQCSIVPWNSSSDTSKNPWAYFTAGTSLYLPYNQTQKVITRLNQIYDMDVTASNGVVTGTYCGVNVNNTYTSEILQTLNITLFKDNGYGASQSNGVRLYKFELYIEPDICSRDFIPAMRLSDGKPGMYDTVSGQFFTNAGTGEFIMGPETPTEFMNFNKCNPCPPNTYKDFVGNSECTPCPDALISPSGSKSASECGRVLHIGDKIYHMKSVKQTSPSLHIRDENGNVWYGNLYSEQE